MSDEQNTPNPIWEADSTHPEKAAEVREALREVMDPEIGLNVIELGLVREATIEDSELEITMIMTTPFCPYAPALLESTRSKAAEASGYETKIEMGMESWDPSMMEEGAGAAWGLF
ncbi:MAG: iron-sulfur cluster assembly protein [Anaerolineales bacterium]|nr:iron-sulfur cluster assembly protein [Anaerolineales bacterium]